MNKKLLSSLSALLLTASLVGGATFAEFSSQATSTGNTFTAGTLILGLTSDKDTSSAATAWSNPNMKPGDVVDGTITLTDKGTIPAKHIFFDFARTNTTLLDQNIIVTKITEKIGTTTTNIDLTALKANMIANGFTVPGDNITLRDFTNARFMSDGNPILASGDAKDYSLTFEFTLPGTTGNEVQGLNTGFTLTCTATQNTDTANYVPLH